MQISTEKYIVPQTKDLNVEIDTKKHVELRLKDSQKNSTEMLKKITTDNSDVRVTLRGKPESVVYTKPEIKHAQATQGLAMEKNIAEKKVIENTPSDGASVGEIAKEVGISLVPVYGTIYEFQKGNIGWGIFGAITDALMLIPVVGAGAKAVGAAIRGGTTAVRAARVGLTAAEATSKITTTTVAKQFTVGASEDLVKSGTGKDLGKAILRAVDPGIELVYGGGGFVGKQTAKLSKNIASSGAEISNINIIKTANEVAKLTKNRKLYTLSTKKPDINDVLNYAHDLIKRTEYSWYATNKENYIKLSDLAARREFNRNMLSNDINSYSLLQKNKMLKNMEGDFGARLRGITDFVAEKVGQNSESMKMASTSSKYTPVMEDIISVLRDQVGKVPLKISPPLYIKNIDELKKAEINTLAEIGIKSNYLTEMPRTQRRIVDTPVTEFFDVPLT